MRGKQNMCCKEIRKNIFELSEIPCLICSSGTVPYCISQLTLSSGLQIRRSNRDDLGIIFNISSIKHIL